MVAVAPPVDRGTAAAHRDNIVALSGIDAVHAGPCIDRVVANTTHNGVVTPTAVDHVAAVTANQAVVAFATAQHNSDCRATCIHGISAVAAVNSHARRRGCVDYDKPVDDVSDVDGRGTTTCLND